NGRAIVEGWLTQTVAQFKQDGRFDTLTPDEARFLGYTTDRKQSLTITYGVNVMLGVPSSIDSYVYTITMDTFGAHPNTFFKTFNFDRETGAELALADLFLPGTPYLQELSTIARRELPKEMGEFANYDSIVAGTEPTEQNFANWTTEGSTLTIIFPPYQVAAYAAGPQYLDIPLGWLDDILKPEYRAP
ncbi:MAG TPA: RsiV family protein, partial [Candidatus Paceibacterota bacterium]|nr:RsiV family protein [Candidatus Paceibacterota bacterium]